jgi:hypothetical protein
MKTNKSPRWIAFKIKKKLGRTSIYAVVSKASKLELGEIKWCSSWRQYAFYPNELTFYEQTCLRDIAKFLDMLTNVRIKKREAGS